MFYIQEKKCPGKLILKKDKTEIKGVHTCGSNMEIIGKTNELSKEDQTLQNFIQKHIRDNVETLEKMPFEVKSTEFHQKMKFTTLSSPPEDI
ncbi:hypothetical protein HZS_7766 [Henneguya salminicola]|nr:hypothetical protein HZS_7766 [Henneguya salminicola]